MDTNSGYQLAIQVMATASAFQRESQRLFRPLGLTTAQFNVLNVLGEKPEGLTQRELSEILVVDRSNTTGLLDRMEEAGWVERTAVPGDRRAHRVVLTESGKALWSEARPRYDQAVAQVMAGFSESELKKAISLLRTLEQSAPVWSTSTTPVS